MSTPKCELCGEPMPPGEEMFKYHGYSGPCPKPALTVPPEPPCPPDRKPHKERVRDIEAMLPEGKTGAVCIDDTPEHRAWYLAEISKYPRLTITGQGVLAKGIYAFRVLKGPSLN